MCTDKLLYKTNTEDFICNYLFGESIMKVTASMVYQQLPSIFAPKKSKENFSDNGLRAPLLYSGELMYPDYMYICYGKDISLGDIHLSTIVSIGYPEFDYTDIKADIIIVDESVSINVLFNQIQLIFQTLTYWDDEMARIALKDMDIDRLFSVGRQHLRFSLVLLNNRFTPIALTPELGDKHMLSENNQVLINTLLSDSSLSDTLEKGEVELFDNPSVRKIGMHFNIFYNSDYRGKLIAISDYTNEITVADKQLFRIFARHFETLYERFAVSPMRSASYESMQEIIRSLINGDDTYDYNEITSALNSVQWKPDDKYAVYYIPYEEDVNIAIKSAYIATFLENKWNRVHMGSTRGVVTDKGIVWVVNCSKPADITEEQFGKEFEVVLGNLKAKAGASNVFDNFHNLRTYYNQAVLAYQYGKESGAPENHYRFREYSLDYMLKHCYLDFELKDVLHPAIRTLIQYDEKENTEFCKTLRLFFLNKYNATQTSDSLFIHRSTFAARIKRIEEICNIDLDDERTRLHIMLSFYLLEDHYDMSLA